MSGHDLLHLALIDGSAPEFSDDVARSVRASCDQAALAAREAFALVPGLRAFSWLSPVLDRLLARADGPTAARACAAGAGQLAAAADDLGAALRLCGRVDDLPCAAFEPPAGAGGERTLLWFQRYSGRDEIVRAAGRFFTARPGARLADGELDAWLDTAGVPDPDLLLYAGGPLEPQDVLIWQGSYAEIWHAPQPGPDFPGGDLRRAVADYHERQRRFGR
jgi:hypothetical protein